MTPPKLHCLNEIPETDREHAATTERPIRIAYPAFGETRDQRLVEIMKGQLKRFDLLLGGTGVKIEGSALDEDERWQYELLAQLPRMRAPLDVADGSPERLAER
jgi:hypothetical protein